MNVTEETKAHAQEILDYLRANPEKHNQNSWVDTGLEDEYGDPIRVVTDQNFCGTTMCVAGTSVWLKGGINRLNDYGCYGSRFDNEGSYNLGLNENEANALFYEANNSEALELLIAVAAGDEAKFYEVAKSHGFIYIDDLYS